MYQRTYIGKENAGNTYSLCALEQNVDIPISFAPDPIVTTKINAQYLDKDGTPKDTDYAIALRTANAGKHVNQFEGLFPEIGSEGGDIWHFPVGGRNLAAFSVANCIYMTPMLIDFDGGSFEGTNEYEPIFAISPYQWIAMASAVNRMGEIRW